MPGTDRPPQPVLRRSASAAPVRRCACGGAVGADGECARCKARRLSREGAAAAPGTAGGAEPLVREALSGGGAPLDGAARATLAPHLGFSFSRVPVRPQARMAVGERDDPLEREAERFAAGAVRAPAPPAGGTPPAGGPPGALDGVRVHTGPAADAAARAVGARAFTVGSHLVFRRGEYQPASEAGMRLIAHEVAHTRQQAGAAGTLVQRAAHDFEIRGKDPDSASSPLTLFFAEGSATLDAAEQAKIAAIATPPGRALTLNGFASEEGSAAGNVSMVNRRIAAVDAALAAAGHTGTRTLNPQPTAGAGRIEYRSMRSVEVVPAGGTSSVPNCSGGAVVPCGAVPNPFTTAQTEAVRLIDGALTKLAAPTPATTAELTRFFGAASGPAVIANLGRIKTHVQTEMTPENAAGPGHRCGNLCDASCVSSEAYNTGTGAPALMTLCPSFMSTASVGSRAGTLIHEGAHGTSGVATDDKAYAHERLITFLSPADALANSDSYVLLVRLLDTPGSVTVGRPTPDALPGALTAPQENDVRRTLAWLEKWLIWAYQEVASLYETINASRPAGSWTNTYYRGTMGLVAPRFGLTAPPAVPSTTDQTSVAAIHDRYHQMRLAMRQQITVTNAVGAAPTAWAAGPGNSVALSAGFFGLGARPQLDQLLAAIVAATPDIGSALEPQYVALVDDIRTHQGGGSP
jgi:outer membrane protein OmpA-like peptidoglycan-associated protein